MAGTPIPLGAYSRSGFPRFSQLNMLAERTPTDAEKGYALIQRPGLDPFATVGAGPIRGFFQKAGVFNGEAVVVSGTEVYRLSIAGVPTLLAGDVSGAGLVSLDGTNIAGASTVRIANGEAVYRVDETTVMPESFPDAAGVSCVAELDGFWFAVSAGTQRVYVLIPGDTAWNALDYTTAEAEPDTLVGIFTLGDELWGFGTDSLQVFALTGVTSPAIRPIPGRRFDVGCKGRDTVVRVGSALCWVDQANMVQRAETVPEVISDSGLAEIISGAGAGTLRAWSFTRDQHAFYILRIGNIATWAHDAYTSLWTQFASKALPYFRAHLGADVSGTVLAADSNSAAIWQVSTATLTDAGDEILRRLCGYLNLKEGQVACNRVQALLDAGVGLIAGQGSDPKLFLSVSRDLGKTFGTQESTDIGVEGAFSTRAMWRPGGTVRAPGWVFLVECSDPIRLRVTDLRMNPA